MQWYYLSDSHERIALSDAQIPVLAAPGVLRPTTPVWRNGLVDWTACGEVKPEIFAGGVMRDSNKSLAIPDSVAIQGTVVGVARVLAGYRWWLWIYGGFMMLIAMAGMAFTGWSIWKIVDIGLDAINHGYGFMDQMKDYGWVIWLLLAFESLVLIGTGWAGWMLIVGGIRAKQARESGSEQILTGSIRNIGRYFIFAVLMLFLNIAAVIGLGLWLGWDKVFPMPGPPPASRVSV